MRAHVHMCVCVRLCVCLGTRRGSGQAECWDCRQPGVGWQARRAAWAVLRGMTAAPASPSSDPPRLGYGHRRERSELWGPRRRGEAPSPGPRTVSASCPHLGDLGTLLGLHRFLCAPPGPTPGGTGGPSRHWEPVAGLLVPAPAVCHGHCARDAPCDSKPSLGL